MTVSIATALELAVGEFPLDRRAEVRKFLLAECESAGEIGLLVAQAKARPQSGEAAAAAGSALVAMLLEGHGAPATGESRYIDPASLVGVDVAEV